MKNILSFIDQLTIIKETNFNIICFCPICGGNDFKISLNRSTYGFFKCWTTGCNNKAIWESLNITDKRKNNSQYKIVPSSPLIFSSVDPPKEISFYSINNYKIPSKEKHWDNLRGNCFKTIYQYSNRHRVCRYDGYINITKEGDIVSAKDTIPQTLIEGKWVNGTHNEFWDLYNYSFIDSQKKFNSVTVHEGEKSASAFSTIGILGLTPRGGGGFNDRNLSYSLLRLKNIRISHLIYIPDNDDPGIKKAETFQQNCYKQNLSCTIIPMKKFWKDVPLKGDFADLLEVHPDYTKYDFLEVIKEL